MAIRERLLTNKDIANLISRVTTNCSTYLYHLSVSFAIRQKRLHSRGPYSLIDLEKDQKDRGAIKKWPGYVYKNIGTPEKDANNLLILIQQDKGLYDRNSRKFGR